MCDGKKSKFIKQQGARGLLSRFGIKTPLSKIPLVDPLCFDSIKEVNTRYKINEIVNNFLLAGDKLMHEMHLSQPGFTHSACGPFKKKRRKNTKI